METKSIFASKTMWGIVLAFAGVLAESVPQIEQLLGTEYAGKIGVVAGLVLAFAGRLTATKAIDRVLPLLAIGVGLVPVLLIGGCGTDGSARSYRAAETMYRGSVEIATDAAAAGLMTPDQAVAFEAARANADAVLDEWGELEAQGLGDTFDGIERLERLLDLMIQMQGGTDGRSSRAHTDPHGRGDPRPGHEDRAGLALGGQDHRRGAGHPAGRAGQGQRRLALAA